MDIKVDNVCRICLNDSAELEPIFEYEFEDVPIVEILTKICTDIQFKPNENDRLPKNICENCIEILCRAHKLNETCLKSEQQFQLLLNTSAFIKVEVDLKPKIEIEDEEDFEVQEHDEEDLDEVKCDGNIEADADMEEESLDEDKSDDKHPIKIRKVAKKHQCLTCLKYFEKPSKLRRHSMTHDVNKKPFACEHSGCFQRFITNASLKRHAILHSGMTIRVCEDKTFECVVCLKVFQVQEALASHMRTHKDDQLEFPCNLCDKVFKKLNDLTRHSRKHPENKSHKCLICSKMFSQGSHLIDHLNRHNNLRPHVCHVCNKGKSSKSQISLFVLTFFILFFQLSNNLQPLKII